MYRLDEAASAALDALVNQDITALRDQHDVLSPQEEKKRWKRVKDALAAKIAPIVGGSFR